MGACEQIGKFLEIKNKALMVHQHSSKSYVLEIWATGKKSVELTI